MQVNEEQVRQKTKQFIITNFFLDTAVIDLGDETSFLENGIVDSTGILEVVTYLQDEFNIVIEDREMLPANLDSLKNIGAFVTRKAGLAATPGLS